LDQTTSYVASKAALLEAKEQTLSAIAARIGVSVGEGVSAQGVLDAIARRRQSAREAGEYDRADEIRESLRSVGIALEDGVDGVRYRIHG
jgi:cysteinyl-tRNA synthetase